MLGYGQQIKAERKKRGLTQEQLAAKCGMATITIRQYESEKREPRFDSLEKIANALNVSIVDLYSTSVETDQIKKLFDINSIKFQLQTATDQEREELENRLYKLEKSYEESMLTSSVLTSVMNKNDTNSANQNLQNENEFIAIKILLASMGYSITKRGGRYFFSINFNNDIRNLVISKDDVDELIRYSKNGLEIFAKSLEIKLTQILCSDENQTSLQKLTDYYEKVNATYYPDDADTTPPENVPEKPPEEE